MKRSLFTTALLALLLLCSGVARGQNDSLPDIQIGSIAISESNDSIVGDGISGHVSYNAETKTLILDNASITERVSLWWRHIRIQLKGENTIQSLFIAPDSCTVVGPGILNIGATTVSIAVDAGRTAYLGLKQQAVLNITASEVGISCMYDYIGDINPIYPVFEIDNSALSISAPTCYYLIPWWRLVSCHLAVPSDVNYDSETHMFTQDGEILFSIHDYMEIRPGTVGVHECPESAMELYPNPTDNVLHVSVTDGEIARVEMFDAFGRITMVGTLASPPSPTYTVDLSSLPSGVYVLRITLRDGGVRTMKVVKK